MTQEQQHLTVMFEELGAATLDGERHAGCCFAFRAKEHPPRIWPRPDFEHRIFLDALTEWYIAASPGANGKYDAFFTTPNLKRVR